MCWKQGNRLHHTAVGQKSVRRVAEATVKDGAQKWIRFAVNPEENVAAKGLLRHDSIPGVVGCVDGTLTATKLPWDSTKVYSDV